MKECIALALFLALLLTGCGGPGAAGARAGTGSRGTSGRVEALPDEWGLTLTAEDVTPMGLNLHLAQSGGRPTGELETGSYFWLERESGGAWTELEPLAEELAWTMEAYLIRAEGDTELEVKWAALYGELPAGSYRLGKEVTDFRAAGDFDRRTYYAYFTVA